MCGAREGEHGVIVKGPLWGGEHSVESLAMITPSCEYAENYGVVHVKRVNSKYELYLDFF